MSKKIIKVNGSSFECMSLIFDASFPAFALLTEDVAAVQEAFKSFDVFELYEDDILVGSYAGWNKYESIKILQDTSLPDGLNFYVVVSLGKEDIRGLVRKLDNQLNPKYNIDDMTLEDVQAMRIKQSKEELAEWLETHPLVSSVHGGEEGTYSVTQEKQALLVSQYTSYILEKQVNPEAVITWNESGKECAVWSEGEIVQLICEIKSYVYPRVSKQQAYECDIKEMASKDEVMALKFDYDTVE